MHRKKNCPAHATLQQDGIVLCNHSPDMCTHNHSHISFDADQNNCIGVFCFMKSDKTSTLFTQENNSTYFTLDTPNVINETLRNMC